jgi:hypothetical protein
MNACAAIIDKATTELRARPEGKKSIRKKALFIAS